uniref:Putative depressant toxin Tx67 n=1 Tax=Buthus israelis TaxID=2899555 RepID=B8XH11_BUTIS|nr:putative depressant toxin Tx67 [Buthus occitanus israelis]
MQLILLLIISASMLIEGLVNADGYLKGHDGCKLACVVNNKYCNKECQAEGGNYGYCYKWKLACYCEGLSEKKTWKPETNKCRSD